MLIANGTVVTAKGRQHADVLVREGRVVEVAPGLFAGREADGSHEETIDASGLLVLPGGVDPHTHFDLLVGGLRATDDFYTGTLAAAAGGTTTILDPRAFGPPAAAGSLTERVEAYHELADGRALIDYGFHGVIDRVNNDTLAEMAALPDLGVTSLKFYMTYEGRLCDEEIIRLLVRAKELGILPCVHCENHATLSWLRERFVAEGKRSPHYHPLSRPDYCEAEAVGRVLALARAAGNAPLYIVHTSTAASLEAYEAQRLYGKKNAAQKPAPMPWLLETCPQYLVLDEALYDAPEDEGLKYVMSPPLRKAHDREALWQALADGRVSTVGTDHCPWNFAKEKQLGRKDFTKCPNGAPGVELRLALMHSEGVVRRAMSLERMVAVCSTLPARIFGLYPRKGTIAPGSDADLVLFDPTRTVRVTHDLLHENVDYTPYEGIEIVGWPVVTISRGEVIMREGAVVAAAGRGRYLHRLKPDYDCA
jgi:dihydropyrimidinase